MEAVMIMKLGQLQKISVVVVFIFILNLNGCTPVAKNFSLVGTICSQVYGYDFVSYVKSMPITVEGLLSLTIIMAEL